MPRGLLRGWKVENGSCNVENGSVYSGKWKLENGNRKREVAWHLSATVHTVSKCRIYITFHPLATPTSCYPRPLATPIDSAHSPKLSSILQSYCTEVWMTILESGWNLAVWLVGVVSMRWVWLVGGICGYGYHV